MDAFWNAIDALLDDIETEQPDTAEKVIALLHTGPDATAGGPITAGHGFFAGSGGDRSLFSALYKAGWRCTWAEVAYYYVARHPATGAQLTYVEGDVYPGDIASRDAG